MRKVHPVKFFVNDEECLRSWAEMGVFGLTGSLGSGKSTALYLLKKKGARIFDVDEHIHRYYRNKKSKVYKKVVSAFPEAVRKNTICRARLGDIVFSHPRKLRILEKIVHPVVVSDLKTWVKSQKKRKGISVAEVPLLFEKKLSFLFDGIIFVSATRKNLIQRIRKQFHLSQYQTEKRLRLFLNDKKKRGQSDFVIENNSSRKALGEKVEYLWVQLRARNKILKK